MVDQETINALLQKMICNIKSVVIIEEEKNCFSEILLSILCNAVELNKGGDLEMRGESFYSNLSGTEPRGYILPKPVVPIN